MNYRFHKNKTKKPAKFSFYIKTVAHCDLSPKRDKSCYLFWCISIVISLSKFFEVFEIKICKFFSLFLKTMFFVIFLIFRHSFFLSSWTADFAKKAKRVSFNLYFKDARRLFLKLVNLIKISWLANIYTQYLRKKKQCYIPYCDVKIPRTYVQSTPNI